MFESRTVILGIDVQNSMFTNFKMNGAIHVEYGLESFNCIRSVFINCYRFDTNGGAARVCTTGSKILSYCCFSNCKTLFEKIGSYRVCGQAYAFDNGNIQCSYNVIYQCAEEANTNFYPAYIYNATLNIKNENTSDCAVYSGGCLILRNSNCKIKNCQFRKSLLKNSDQIHFKNEEGSAVFSYCNVIEITSGTLFNTGSKIRYCCVYRCGSVSLGISYDNTNSINGYTHDLDIFGFSQKCTVKIEFTMSENKNIRLAVVLNIFFVLTYYNFF